MSSDGCRPGEGERARRRPSRAAKGALAVLALACGCGGRDVSAAARPNVLVVCIDALRADRLGAYGASPSPSPSLDALAGEGLTFTNATSVASWTKPSVPSILTGLYPDEHGVFDNSRTEVDRLADGHATLAQMLAQHGWRTGAFVENDQLARHLSGLDRGFSLYMEEAGEPPEISDRFLNWAALDAATPWFAYLHFFDPHFPYAPDDFLFAADEAARLGARTAHWDLRGEFWWLMRERVNRGAMRLDADAIADLDRLYRLEIAEVDAVVGRMLGALDRAGVLDRTLVLVTADHGEGFLERGRMDHGYGPYRELLHIPLLVRLPGREKAAARSDVLAQNVDVAATVLDVLDLPAPRDWSSRSLVAAVADPATARPAALAQERHGHSSSFSVRNARYSYVRSETTPAKPRRRALVPPSMAAGLRVRAQGVFDGTLLVAGSVKAVAPGDPDIEVEGPVERVDETSRSIRVLGVELAVGDGLSDGAGNVVAFPSLARGRHVRVHGAMDGGVFRAAKVQLVEKGPIEIEGVVRRVEPRENGDAAVDVGGVAFLVDPEVRWSDFADEPRQPSDEKREIGTPEVVEELFDRIDDPAELRDIAAAAPAELARLRAVAGEWRAGLRTMPQAERADLDDETRERLRSMGYVE